MSIDKTILAVIGNPIAHSLSPLMHNHVLKQQGLDWEYQARLIESESDIPGFLDDMRGSQLRGINVTVPYKETVIPYLDHLDETALVLGAVNTIVNEAGKLIGYNTDAPGFVSSLDFDWAGAKVVIVGAGGSAKAIAYAVSKMGIQSLCIQNRRIERAESIAKKLAAQGINDSVQTVELNSAPAYEALVTADLVIQCTNVGMDGISNPLDNMDWVQAKQMVVDIIYSPLKPPFLAEAESRGASIQNGLPMLAGQAAKAFEYFTQKTVGFQVFYDILENHIKGD